MNYLIQLHSELIDSFIFSKIGTQFYNYILWTLISILSVRIWGFHFAGVVINDPSQSFQLLYMRKIYPPFNIIYVL